jgi:hypothetical protein
MSSPALSSLTPVQEQVLALLSAGSTLSAAADAAGVHRNTVMHWRRSSAAFRRALDRSTIEKALYWRDQADNLAAEALATIRSVMNDAKAPATSRLKAALTIMQRALVVPASLEPAEEADPEPAAHPEPKNEIVHKNAQSAQRIQNEPTDSVLQAHEHCVDRQNEPIRPYVRPGPEIGRNDPCPCGSGQKFKRCCLAKANGCPPELGTPSN